MSNIDDKISDVICCGDCNIGNIEMPKCKEDMIRQIKKVILKDIEIATVSYPDHDYVAVGYLRNLLKGNKEVL